LTATGSLNSARYEHTATRLNNGLMLIAEGCPACRASLPRSARTWSVTGGSLPGWATLNSSTGAITGTPSAAGTWKFTVTVTDSTLPTHQGAHQSLSLTSNSATAVPCAVSGSESLLSGQYAFSLSGYTSTGYWAVVGSGNRPLPISAAGSPEAMRTALPAGMHPIPSAGPSRATTFLKTRATT